MLVASRWLEFATLSVVFGSSLFWFYASAGPLADRLRSLPVTAARTTRLSRIAALVAAPAGMAWLVATIANVTGGLENVVDPAMLRVFILETPFGSPAVTRILLFGVLVTVAVIPMPPARLAAMNLLVATPLLVSQAWLGHAAEGGASLFGTAMIATYAAHVLGAAAWVGGLPALALALAERRGGPDDHDLLRRYSTVATVAVAVIVLSGVANAAFHVGGDLDQLPASGYGKVLFAKLALVTAMLCLAAINRFALMPRLGDSLQARTSGLLRASVAVELLLAILVLGAAAVLGITPPPQ